MFIPESGDRVLQGTALCSVLADINVGEQLYGRVVDPKKRKIARNSLSCSELLTLAITNPRNCFNEDKLPTKSRRYNMDGIPVIESSYPSNMLSPWKAYGSELCLLWILNPKCGRVFGTT